jgi:quercetin dioxygenase-like cupin family protein
MSPRTFILAALVFTAGVAVGTLVPSLSAQTQTRPTETKDLMMPVDLGTWCPGKQVTMQLVSAAPGTSARHYHPAHSFTYVLDGSETKTVDGKAPVTVRAGDVLHESPAEIHETRNTAPVKLLVVRVMEKGKEMTVRLP